jgi:ABC-type uncharacterized transport system permease subunit
MRTKTVLFFTFVFPLVWLFVFEGIFAHGDPKTILYFFGPVVTLNIMGSAFWGLGLQSVMQRERGILRRYRLAPISAVSLVAANLLANYLLELPTIGLLVLCAKLIFHMPLTFGWWTLFVLVTIGTFGFAGFGLTIASIANTMQEAQIYNNLIWVTLLFLSGATIPLPLLPHWIQRVATFLPATYLVTSFQAIMIQAEPLLNHLPEMFALALSGVFGLLFAWKLFRWEKEEKIPNRAKAWALLFVLPFGFIGAWMTIYANPTKAWASTYSLLGAGSSKAATATDAELRTWSIEDFDHYNSGEDLTKSWQVALLSPRNPASAARLNLITPGAQSTAHALRIQGRFPQATGPDPTLVIASSSLRFPQDLKNWEGLEFWVRGDARACRIRIVSKGTRAEAQPEITLVPDTHWQSIRIPVAFAASGSAPGPAADWNLQVAVGGTPGDFFFDLDQIELYAPPDGPAKPSGRTPLVPK